MKKLVSVSICLAFLLCDLLPAAAQSTAISAKMPASVIDISKANTYSNPSHDTSELVPGSHTKILLKTAKTPIENARLIKLLNESTIHPSKWSIGYSARIYLGAWPLNYSSQDTSVNWEYKKVNDNAMDARGIKTIQKVGYLQKSQIKILGGLTSKVPRSGEVRQLIMAKTIQKTQWPISFSTIIGTGTKIDRPFSVQPKQIGHLSGYVPAVYEKGRITYGEVFLILRGGAAELEVKNIVQQNIGAYLPIQDHLFLRYIAN
ncbi:MAG: YfkD family protein [Sporolactobacillus sp.]